MEYSISHIKVWFYFHNFLVANVLQVQNWAYRKFGLFCYKFLMCLSPKQENDHVYSNVFNSKHIYYNASMWILVNLGQLDDTEIYLL